MQYEAQVNKYYYFIYIQILEKALSVSEVVELHCVWKWAQQK